MKLIALILSFTLGLTTAAQAGFFNNRVDWKSLPPTVKEGYAVGLYDAFTIATDGDTQKMRTYKENLSECSREMGFTIPILVELIDTHYLNASNWKHPPVIALLQSMNRACDIN